MLKILRFKLYKDFLDLKIRLSLWAYKRGYITKNDHNRNVLMMIMADTDLEILIAERNNA